MTEDHCPDAAQYLTRAQSLKWEMYRKEKETVWQRHVAELDRYRRYPHPAPIPRPVFDHARYRKKALDFLGPRQRAKYEQESLACQRAAEKRNQGWVTFRLRVGLQPVQAKQRARPEAVARLWRQLAQTDSHAWRVIRASYDWLAQPSTTKETQETYLKDNLVQVTLYTTVHDAVQEVIDNYGEGAADGWMEGDTAFDRRHEITLRLQRRPTFTRTRPMDAD